MHPTPRPPRRIWSRRHLLAAAPALPLTVFASGCADTTDADLNDGFVGGRSGVAILAAEKRKPAPIASGLDLDGEPLSTADFPDRVLVINVWGSWCAPCRKEAPDLVEAAQETAETTQFFGINTRDLDPSQAQAFVRAFSIPYPSLYDPSGAELLKFTDLPPGAIPSTLIIDSQHRVAARAIGSISKLSLLQLIDDVEAPA